MRFILAPFRIVTVFLAIFVYMAHMCVVFLLVRDRWRRIRWSNRLLQRYARFALTLFNVKVNPIGLENLKGLRGTLLVGNHTGYMDVLAISSQVPTCFVTSVEIKNAPLLGQICQLAGCMFVERRNKNNIHNELSELRQGLNLGLNVAIFPEATSTNGEQILRFKRPLFLSAVDAGCPVVPFCLNYRKVGGAPINVKNRDSVFWYGDMTFVRSIVVLASCGGADLDLHFLPHLATHPDMDARDLAERSQQAVESVFLPVR